MSIFKNPIVASGLGVAFGLAVWEFIKKPVQDAAAR